MEIKAHKTKTLNIAEVISDEVILKNLDDGLDLIGNLSYQGFDKIIIHEKNISADFFDLKTKLAGDILQKFIQYRMALAIVGEFKKYKSRSLNEYIFESNKGKTINFVASVEEALKEWAWVVNKQNTT